MTQPTAAPLLQPLPPLHPAAPEAPPVAAPMRSIVAPVAPAKPKPATKAAPKKSPAAKKPAAGGSKASAAKKPAAKADGSPAAKAKEVDVETLPEVEVKKRVAAIYKLERVLERKRIAYDTATRHRNAAKAELEAAEEALQQELDEQRFGPGPLFNPTGTGPAKA